MNPFYVGFLLGLSLFPLLLLASLVVWWAVVIGEKMTTIFLLVHVLLYASGQVYTDGPWIFTDWNACESAQKHLNMSHVPLLGEPGQPVRTAWACIRLVQP